MVKAETIESFAYTSSQKNRFVGTPGLGNSMHYIWDTLEDLDYYDISRQSFEFDFNGKRIETYVRTNDYPPHPAITRINESAGTTSSPKPRRATLTMSSISVLTWTRPLKGQA